MNYDRKKPVPVLMRVSWYCTACGIDTNTDYWSNQDSLAVKNIVLAQHAAMSPACGNDWMRFRQPEMVEPKVEKPVGQPNTESEEGFVSSSES